MDQKFAAEKDTKMQALDTVNGVWAPAFIEEIAATQVTVNFYRYPVIKERVVVITEVPTNEKKWPIRLPIDRTTVDTNVPLEKRITGPKPQQQHQLAYNPDSKVYSSKVSLHIIYMYCFCSLYNFGLLNWLKFLNG